MRPMTCMSHVLGHRSGVSTSSEHEEELPCSDGEDLVAAAAAAAAASAS